MIISVHISFAFSVTCYLPSFITLSFYMLKTVLLRQTNDKHKDGKQLLVTTSSSTLSIHRGSETTSASEINFWVMPPQIRCGTHLILDVAFQQVFKNSASTPSTSRSHLEGPRTGRLSFDYETA